MRGVLYEVPDFLIERKAAAAQNRKSLDAIEGEGTNYKRETIAVRQDSGLIVKALTYRCGIQNQICRPAWNTSDTSLRVLGSAV